MTGRAVTASSVCSKTMTTGVSPQTTLPEQTVPAGLADRVPDGLPEWLAASILEAQRETETLRENGATEAATARATLTRKLLADAGTWLDAKIDVAEAARASGMCAETIRRAVRRGDIPDQRDRPGGHHRIRRGDVERFAASGGRSYDPDADAQNIARLRRQFP